MLAIRPALCILSPHRDDAVFSLGLAIKTWRARGLRLSVVTIYTRSQYAPRRPLLGREREPPVLATVSDLRAREDRKVLRRIGRYIPNRDLHRLDAPVRLSCTPAAVFAPREQIADETEVRQLAPYFERCLQGSLMLAPLALGNHIDHATVRNAALAAAAHTAAGPARLGFYEDLPYADWTPSATLQANVAACEATLHMRLAPAIIRYRSAVPCKHQLARAYSSQIDEKEALRIARFSLRYGGGERIWIPARGRARWAG